MTHAEWLRELRSGGDLSVSSRHAELVWNVPHQARLALAAICANFAGHFSRAASLLHAASVAEIEATARGSRWPLIVATWSADLALLSGEGISNHSAVNLLVSSQALGHERLKREAWATLARSLLREGRTDDAAHIFAALRDTENPHEHERRSVWSAGLALARCDREELDVSLLHAGAVDEPLPRALRYSLVALVAEQIDDQDVADDARRSLKSVDIPSVGLIEERLDLLIDTSSRCVVY